MTWTYRPAIDGLRSLAVYLVVLYHVGVAWLPGGFVGVDLFFVLSGFLVSTILFEELSGTGRLDLIHFYDRRVRRLLPAACVVIVASCAMAVVLFSTVRRAPMVGDAQSALLYVSNWRFLLQSNDYFGATSVDASPFLHFWSLSIEEQFYFFFPVLLVVLTRLGRRWRPTTVVVLTALFVASVAAQVYWAGVDQNHAYYGTEARLYQLIAGALLALALARLRGTPDRPASLLAGRRSLAIGVVSLIGVVVVASSLVEVSPSTRGLAVTTFAVGLVGSMAAVGSDPLIRVFSWSPLVYLGKISYGTYLWHWPVIIFLAEVISPPTPVLAAIVVAVSTAFAAASYQMLERPIRARRISRGRRVPVLVVGLATSVLAAFVIAPTLLESDRRPDLVASLGTLEGTAANVDRPVPDIDYVKFARDEGPLEQYCRPDDTAKCEVVTGEPGPEVLLVGDSHGRMLWRAVARLAREHHFNLSVSVLGGCPWSEGLVVTNQSAERRETCASVRKEVYQEIVSDTGTDLVLLTQNAREIDKWADTLVVEPGFGDVDLPFDERIYRTTEKALDDLHDSGVRALIVTSIWLPADESDPLDCLAGAESTAACRVPISRQVGVYDSIYRTADVVRDDVYTVDINPAFCPAAPVCDPVLDGVPVWRDPLHYSPRMVVMKRAQIWDAIEETGAFDGLSD